MNYFHFYTDFQDTESYAERNAPHHDGKKDAGAR